MKYLDFILAIPLLWGGIMGFRKGLIIELASIVALVLGIVGSIHFSSFTAQKLNTHLEISTDWLGFVAFLTTFIAIVLGVFLLAKVLDKAIKAIALGLLNRIAGMIFGILKYALVVSFLLYFLNQLNAQFLFLDEGWNSSSYLYDPIMKISNLFSSALDKVNIPDPIELIDNGSNAR